MSRQIICTLGTSLLTRLWWHAVRREGLRAEVRVHSLATHGAGGEAGDARVKTHASHLREFAKSDGVDLSASPEV